MTLGSIGIHTDAALCTTVDLPRDLPGGLMRAWHPGGATRWSSVTAPQGDDILLLRRVRTNLLQLRDNTLGPVLHDRDHRHAEGELVGNDMELLDPGRSGREFGGVEDLVADAEAKVLLHRHRFQT